MTSATTDKAGVLRRKLLRLALWCLGIAAGLFALAYGMYHYMTPEGVFTAAFRQEPGKPFITGMVADLGVLHLFGGSLTLLVRGIFFKK